MRKHMKRFVAFFTAVTILFSMYVVVSASRLDYGEVVNVDYNYAYTWEYYTDDVLKIYPRTSDVVINVYDLPRIIRVRITNETLIEIDVSDLFTDFDDFRSGHLQVYGHNCLANTIKITGDTLENFYAVEFCGFEELREVTFDEVTTLSYIKLNNCGIDTVDIFAGDYTSSLIVESCNNLDEVFIPEGIRYMDISFCENVTFICTPRYFQSLYANNLPLLEDMYFIDDIDSCKLVSVGYKDITVPLNCDFFNISSDSLLTATIEEGRTSVDANMFKGCFNLNSVYIPDSVTAIEYRAFTDCFDLNNIELPASVNSIGSMAFAGSGIENIVIPDGVTSIEYATFRWCENLEWVDMPSGITKIDETAFENCSNLESVIFHGSRTQWENITIYDEWNDKESDMTIDELFGDTKIWYMDLDCYLTQPEDFYGPVGSTATFSVETTDNIAWYKWDYSFGDDIWEEFEVESATTAQLEFTVTEDMDGMLVRCVATEGTWICCLSDSASVNIIEPVTIVEEPENVKCSPGEMAVFTVEAEGEGLTYQWKVNKAEQWANCSTKDGAKTDTLTLEAKDSRDGTVYMCVITDKYGYIVTTKQVTLTVSNPLEIKTQPKDCSGYAGETATFTVKATGSGLKYQWKTLKNGIWTNCSVNDGAKTNKLTLEIKSSRDGSKYQCVITDKHGITETTNEVTLTVNKPLSIKTQPSDVSGAEGSIAQFKVVAEGAGLKYQWQVFKDGAWTNCSINDGAKTDTLSLEIKPSRSGLKYHCIVTDKTGASVTSNEATLTMKNPLILVNSPVTEIIAYSGTYVNFTIQASGDGLKYQWQVFKNGEWTNCSVKDGAKTDTMTLEAKTSRDGLKYHCVVTDKYGQSLTSEEITLSVIEFVVINPERSVSSPEVTSPDIANCLDTVCYADSETIESADAVETVETVAVSEVIEVAEVIETFPDVEDVTIFD